MVATARVQEPRQTSRTGTILVWTAFGAAALLSLVLLLHLGRGLTWFFDEWNWIQDRRTGSVDDFLRNHNGHLIALPILAYKIEWSWFGLGVYTAMRVYTVLLHLATCGVLLVWLRRRLRNEFALALVVAVLFLGYAWQDLLWPSQTQYFGSMLGGIAALVFLDRRDVTGDVLASIALGVALASSGIGLPFVGAVGLILVLRRNTWRRLWVPVAPLALYGLWYARYGASQAKGENLHRVPGYVEKAGASAAGALFGRGIDTGHVLAAALAVLVIVTVAVRRRMSPELAGIVALPILFWTLTAMSRAQSNEPGASRYLYPGAIFVVLVLGQLIDDPHWPRTTRSRVVAVTAAAVLLVVSLAGNVVQLRDGASGLRDVSTFVKAELAALELARGHVNPDYQPDLSRAPQLFAGPYFRAVDDLGSPADSIRELRAAAPEVRAAADAVLLGAIGVKLAPGAPAGSSCTTVMPTDGVATTERTGDAPTLVVTADGGTGVDVASRNLADGFETGSIGTVEPGTTRSFTLPTVRSGPWTVRLTSRAPFRVC